ncbi:MAG: tetratricopeptide repeat protein [Asticcacaulis sp.]
MSKSAKSSGRKGFAPAVMADKAQTGDFKPKLTDTALPFRPTLPKNPASQIMGDSGSSEALRLLAEATEHIKRADTIRFLRDALALFKTGDWQGGSEQALLALHVDEKSPEAWHVLAVARDKCNDFTTALTCYETALRLSPENPNIANDLGRLAYRMGMTDMAEKFFRFFLSKQPGNIEGINNLATTLRESSQMEAAIDLLRDAIHANPTNPLLWNALGTVVNATGDMDNAILFYQETLKYDPRHVHARYNLGNAKVAVGQVREGLADLLLALSDFVDTANILTCKLSIAFAYLNLGEYEEGWKWYGARNQIVSPERVHYLIDRPKWDVTAPLKGRSVFVTAEQGLGDEIMFANLIPDLLRDIGPDGKLGIGVEPRLLSLFQRSFPEAEVVYHHTTKYQAQTVRLFPKMPDWSVYEGWAVMGDFLNVYRKKLSDFANPPAFLKPDPERVAYWQTLLNDLNDKPKIGILWKSLVKHSRRDRYYSPFEQWETVLRTPGLQFVNLQYGDTTEELAQAKEMGLDIWTPPGIDLKMDLDDLCALTKAMDCIICPANATSNIAGAAGVQIWLVSPEGTWTSLGTDHFPWYPKVRVFFSESLTDWTPVMNRMQKALCETFLSEDG